MAVRFKPRIERLQDDEFGVSASCFAANMAVKQNAIELAHKYLLAAEAVLDSFYVDDGLTGAEDIESAITLQRQLQDLFTSGGFMLTKWNSSEPLVLQAIFPDLLESREILGVNWNTVNDTFHISISSSPPSDVVTKRTLASDIAKVFDVLGWFAPTTVNILTEGVGTWNQSVPDAIRDVWSKWRSELPSLSAKLVTTLPKDQHSLNSAPRLL